jgi:glucose-6-phosphate dehydrogenase assembly protein OpcA
MTVAVSAEKILRELHELWANLAKAETEDQSTAVLRACSMTLIVATEEIEESEPVGEAIACLMREHPSRAVVLRVMRDATGMLDSRVFAQCWTPFGGRQQICCEQIEITVSPDMIADVTALIPGIVVPDLPVVLWCRTGPLILMPEFQKTLDLADKLIVDSSDFGDTRESLRRMMAVHETGRCFADLNWTRLTRWREAVSQAFDPVATREKLKDLSQLVIAYRTPETPITAWYLAAWVQVALGRDIPTRMEVSSGKSGRTIQEVTLSGPGILISVARTESNAVQVKVDSLDSCAIFPRHAEHQLVDEELSLLNSDSLYDSVLKKAFELAHSVREGG